ncbi:transmembrane protein [Achlya hypogyna]|uniref:Transmembrane protein n=1 Tax=Achlya hypogyna TaxID=1202772 RepID=A0A1V9Z0I5_ACHHY|nr:transmembrane protein [Achlya hypogyna]
MATGKMRFVPTEKPKKIWLLDERQLEDFAILDHHKHSSLGILATQTLDYDPYASSYAKPSEFDDGDGALRSGETLKLLSLEAVGLLSQYSGVGILFNTFPALAYPVFQNYLHMQGYQVSSYTALINLGWSFKIFFGVLSDCIPIFGLQRRPYIILGWVICAACCAAMAFMPFAAPYYGSHTVAGRPRENLTDTEIAKYINTEAPRSSGLIIVLSMVASLGYVMAVTACDAMAVQYAQREPLEARGRMQTTMYFVRDFSGMVPQILVGFCMNDYRYGGSFDWAISPSTVYGILLIPCGVCILTATFLMVEEKVLVLHFSQYLKNLWQLMQLRVMWQFCAFQLLNQAFIAFDTTVSSPIASTLLHVQPVADQSFTVLGIFLYTGTMFSIGRFALNWDWHRTVIAHTVLLVAIDASFKLPVVWGAMDSEYYYLAGRTLLQLPTAFLFLFTTYCIVEVADVGNEGAVYALVTSCANIAVPVATFFFKTVDSFFAVTIADIARNDTSTKWQLSYCYFIAYAVKLLSLVWLVLLPRQKAHVQLLKRSGSRSRSMGITMVVVMSVCLLGVIVTNLLAIFPSTTCLRIAGGSGPVGEWVAIESDSQSDLESCQSDYGSGLRAGEPVLISSASVRALLAQYAGVGLLQSALLSLSTPVFDNRFHLREYQLAAYCVLVTVGWGLRVAIGLLSDCLPIWGLHRRPYMVLGWTLCAASCLAMALTPLPATLPTTAPFTASISAKTTNFFLMMSVFAGVGCVIVLAAADAMVVALAQTERIWTRGRLQTLSYATRLFATAVPQVFIGVGIMGSNNGTSFGWAPSPTIVYYMLSFASIATGLTAIVWMHEPAVLPRSRRQYLSNLWHLLQQRVLWQLGAYQLLSLTFFSFDSTATFVSKSVEIERLSSQLWDLGGILMVVGAMIFMSNFGLAYDWRRIVALHTVIYIVVDASVKISIIWNGTRDPYIYLVSRELLKVPRAVLLLPPVYCIVEVADIGTEGAVAAFIATSAGLATPLAVALTRATEASWVVKDTADTAEMRWRATYSYILAYGVKLLSLAWLVLLPRQKAHVLQLKLHGGSSRLGGGLLTIGLILLLSYVVASNFPALFDSTDRPLLPGTFCCP